MKIGYVISSVDKTYGGTTVYVQSLVNALNNKIKPFVFTLNSENPVEFNTDVIFSETSFPFVGGYSTELLAHLKSSKCDVFHGNGLWEQPVHQMIRYAKKINVPVILSTHGMLDEWSLNKGALKKKIALKLFQYRDLQDATCIHATSMAELKSIRKMGLKNPIAVIPNGVKLDEFDNKQGIDSRNEILFLSRIHEVKGIEYLIKAWSQIDLKIRDNWTIEIVGNGEENYILELKRLIKDLNVDQSIFIKEPVFGQEKARKFQDADLFVLPTFTENFGIVVAEALASNLPVITTHGAPWKDLEDYHCGWWVELGVESLKAAIVEAIELPKEELKLMGGNGRELVEKKYSISSVTNMTCQLYEWLLRRVDKPDFVYL